MSMQNKERRGPWVAIVLCGLLAIVAEVLAILSSWQWKVPLVVAIGVCFVLAVITIYGLREEIRLLRRQVVKLEDLAGIAPAAKGEAPKGAYSVDEDGQRRLHISRLEVFLLFVPTLALLAAC